MQVSLVQHFLEQHAQRRPEAVLVIDGRQTATYGDIETASNQVAHALRTQGIDRGDRVGLVAQNSRLYVETYYGILKSGAIAVSLNAAADWHTHCKLLRLCGARGLVCGPRLGRRAQGVGDLPALEFVIGVQSEWTDKFDASSTRRVLDHQALVNSMKQDPPDIALAPHDRAAIVYTSGSTGDPKGATLTHANLVANTRSIVEYLNLRTDDRLVVVLPFHYVYGKSLLNTHVAAGGSIVIENSFLFPQKALDTLERTGATGFSGVPSTFAILLNRSNFATREFPNLRYVTQAGGPMAPELQRRLIKALPGKQIFIMYGATEASARLSYLDPADLLRKLGSIGKAIPGVQLHVLRPNGTKADAGEVGELVACGANIMEGYWNDPEATGAVLDEHGFHTGDLGKRDAEGFLYVFGRKREMIKSGGHRISPKEIEDTLIEHPQVHEAAVIGVPDEILGEAILACVTARPKQLLVPDAIVDWCRLKLPPYKVPCKVAVRRELPRSSAGKINKLLLAKELSIMATVGVQ